MLTHVKSNPTSLESFLTYKQFILGMYMKCLFFSPSLPPLLLTGRSSEYCCCWEEGSFLNDLPTLNSTHLIKPIYSGLDLSPTATVERPLSLVFHI